MANKFILKCDMSDLDILEKLYNSVTVYLENTINYPKWTSGVYPCRSSIEKAISEGTQYMCVCDEEVVGAFILNEDPQGDYSQGDWKSELQEGDYLVIHTFAVSNEALQKGIGTFMVNYCIKKAKSEGYQGIRLDVVPGNTPAIKLYEKSGFSFAGEKDLLRGMDNIPTFELYELNI